MSEPTEMRAQNSLKGMVYPPRADKTRQQADVPGTHQNARD
ncbi:MAG: hypothetical protein QM803_18790 [Rhodocyclaceae bacterium]